MSGIEFDFPKELQNIATKRQILDGQMSEIDKLLVLMLWFLIMVCGIIMQNTTPKKSIILDDKGK